jgi:hypothetical protein
MRKLLLVLWALTCLPTTILPSTVLAQQTFKPCHTSNGSNCIPEFGASNSAKISVAAVTTTEVLPLVTGARIYITSFDFMAAGNNNVKLVYGTGSACGTGTTDLTGAYPLIAQAGISKGNGTGAILFIPVSNALCITTSGAGQVSGSVSYAQF